MAFGRMRGLRFWIPLCTHYEFCSLFCTAHSTWLLNAHARQQPGDCDVDWSLQGVGKAWASTLLLQRQGDGLSLDLLTGEILWSQHSFQLGSVGRKKWKWELFARQRCQNAGRYENDCPRS